MNLLACLLLLTFFPFFQLLFLPLSLAVINQPSKLETLKRTGERVFLQKWEHDEAVFMQHCTMSISAVLRPPKIGIEIQFKNFMLHKSFWRRVKIEISWQNLEVNFFCFEIEDREGTWFERKLLLRKHFQLTFMPTNYEGKFFWKYSREIFFPHIFFLQKFWNLSNLQHKICALSLENFL